MIINSTKDFKEICKTILYAIDTSDPTLVKETLELVAEDGILSLSVTNREYFATARLSMEDQEKFRATVNSSTFLKLVSQLTTDTLELVVDGSSLIVKADGTYKIPLIFKDEELLELPRIELNNITTSMNVSGLILNNILTYNSKELQSAKVVYKPAQKCYYLDENGAITFTTGACVNNFNLEKPVKLLLSQKVVKLFKLFSEDDKVLFEISQDQDVNGDVFTNVRFSTDSVEITTTTPSDTKVIDSVPVQAIRDMSNRTYDYSVLLDRDHLVKILGRLLVFKDDLSIIAEFKFSNSSCQISYCNNVEEIGYNDAQLNPIDYTLYLNIETLKNILDGCQEEFITLNFGDHKAVVIVRQSVRNIVPEWVK